MSAYTAIASQTLGSSASSVTFSSLPQGFRDLIIVCDYTSSSAAALQLTMNAGVTGTTIWARGNGSSSSAGSQTVTPLEFGGSVFTTSTDRGLATIHLFDYSQTNKQKSILFRLGVTTGSNPGTVMASSRFLSTAAITSLTLNFGGGQQFQSGNTFSLYGISA